ncbi:MAG: hypothetical protein RSA66_08875 [Muribaculaceae bacterium]
MPNNTEVKSNRDRYSERLKSKYPDKEYSDDEALFGQINDDYDGYDQQLSEYQVREKSLSDLFASNPRSATFLTDWRNGEDPIVAMVRKFGDDFKSALEDPDKQEALATANKEYAERISKERDYDEQYQKNITATLSTLEKMQQEEGISDDDIDKAMDLLIGIMKDGLLGNFAKESILMAIKALNHDGDVEQADREGEVRGRNIKIEEKLRKGGKNDGTANLAGKNGGGNGSTRQIPDLGAIERGYGTQDIWERGGEKRKAVK